MNEQLNIMENRLPQVAIVILNWNGKGFLEKFLPSVLASTYSNKRIIVADNASTDDSVEFLKNTYPTIEILLNPVNEGYAKGYNSALEKVQSDYFVLLNSDVEVTPGWVEPIIELMEKNKLIAACQPRILSHADKSMFEYAGAAGGWIDNFGYPFMRGRVFDDCEKDNGQYDLAEACFWASGAALFVRAPLYKELGGLDEYFFAHQEEIDLCWRLQREGYKIFVQPASKVYHVGGGTLPTLSNRKVYFNFRNNLVMMHKNLPFSQGWKIPVRIMLNAIAAVRYLFQGNGGYFLAIARAHRHFVGWLLFGKKQKSKGKKVMNFPGFYKGCIVWDYFIRKKKTFSEIVGSN